jgi:hypothetical protein
MADLSTSDTLSDARNVTEGDIARDQNTRFRHKTVNQICEYAVRKASLPKKSALIDLISEWV